MAGGDGGKDRGILMAKWIQKAREKMEKKGTVGSLHRALDVPEGKKIPLAKM